MVQVHILISYYVLNKTFDEETDYNINIFLHYVANSICATWALW